MPLKRLPTNIQTQSDWDNIALKCYSHPAVSLDEFSIDVKRFLYLKKLFYRYVEHQELKERLILNHIITLHNCFDGSLCDMLFFKIPQEYWPAMCTFLAYLNIIDPKKISIKLDENVMKILESL